MFAVVEINGHQYKVQPNSIIQVEKLSEKPGTSITFEKVLLISDQDEKQIKIGMPYVNGSSITAKVIEQIKGEKIRIFKFKPKKRQSTTKGHRQKYTLLQIESIK